METSPQSVSLPQVDNTIYDQLGEQWYHAYDNPVALLRAESRLKTPWIHQRLQARKLSNCQVLDIGCGAGFLSNGLSDLGYSVTGVDLSEDSLRIAAKYDRSGKVLYQKSDAYALPFADAQFDAVTAMDFLEHVEEPNRVIQEASRVLKPGGVFFFHTFNRNWVSGLVVIKGVEWFVKNTPKNMHVLRLFITPEEMASYCAQAGMQVREVTGLRPRIGFKDLPYFFRRIVPPSFSFALTPGLKISYLGYAESVKIPS